MVLFLEPISQEIILVINHGQNKVIIDIYGPDVGLLGPEVALGP